MFSLIKYGVRLRIIDVILDNKLHINNNSGSSNIKFSYINDKILSKNASSKVKKRRYSNGNR